MKHLLSLLFLLSTPQNAVAEPVTPSLLELSGVEVASRLSKSILVLVDYQNEYTTGKLPLWQVQDVIQHTVELLQLARNKGVPVVHVVHDGGSGGLFDLSTQS